MYWNWNDCSLLIMCYLERKIQELNISFLLSLFHLIRDFCKLNFLAWWSLSDLGNLIYFIKQLLLPLLFISSHPFPSLVPNLVLLLDVLLLNYILNFVRDYHLPCLYFWDCNILLPVLPSHCALAYWCLTLKSCFHCFNRTTNQCPLHLIQ